MSTHLSLRLKEVASFVPQGARLADIGSDHAFLPVFLVTDKRIDFAVAGEVVKGPYEIAKAHVAAQALQNQIQVRLANGLAAFSKKDEIDTIVIAGMGGVLITQILEAGLEKINAQMRVILQANNHEDTLREWLSRHGFEIISEKIVEDADKIYEMMVAKKTDQKQELSVDEIKFGPCLKKEKSAIFIKKWQKEYQTRQYILSQLPNPTMPKYQAVKEEVQQIKEILK